MTIKMIFEKVETDTGGYWERAKVPGGWLIRETQEVCQDLTAHGRGMMESGWQWRTALVFIPDPNHEWVD